MEVGTAAAVCMEASGSGAEIPGPPTGVGVDMSTVEVDDAVCWWAGAEVGRGLGIAGALVEKNALPVAAGQQVLLSVSLEDGWRARSG